MGVKGFILLGMQRFAELAFVQSRDGDGRR